MSDDDGSGQRPDAASNAASDPPENQSGAVRKAVAVVLLVGVGTGLSQAYSDLGVWALLVGAAMIAIAAGVVVEGVGAGLRRQWEKRRNALESTTTQRVLVGLAVLAAVGVFAGVAGPPLSFPIDQASCNPPSEFTVVTSEGDRATAQELVGAFEADSAVTHAGCATSTGYVYETDTSTLAAGLRQDWNAVEGRPGAPVPVRDIGARPDLWMTISSLAVNRLSDEVGNLGPSRSDPGPIATSPVVVTAPGPADQTGTAGMSWNAILDNPPGRDLVRADPQQSVGAALATAGLYGIDVDRNHRTPVDVPTRDARTIEAFLGRSAAASSFPQATESDLLCRARQTGGSTPALIMSEQSMVRFNLGRPVDQCPATSRPPGPGLVLHAFYPHTPALDQHSVVLRWPGAATPATTAAQEFDEWLRSDRSSDALHCAGLRAVMGSDHPTCRWTGTLDNVLASAPDVDPTTTAVRVLGGQKAAAPQRRTEVLEDVSGSMSTAEPGGATRLAAVASAAAGPLGAMRADDVLGLRQFPGDAAATGSREVVALGAASGTSPAVIAALQGASAAGNTPLYTSIVESVRALQSTTAGQVDRLLVISDGDDTSSSIGAADVLAALQGSGVRLRVVIVGNEVTCAAPLFRDLAPTALGTCDDESSGVPLADAIRRAVED